MLNSSCTSSFGELHLSDRTESGTILVMILNKGIRPLDITSPSVTSEYGKDDERPKPALQKNLLKRNKNQV